MRSRYLELLDQRIVLVTPSRRMAGLIADRYSAAMLAAGLTTWEAPAAMPFGAWLPDAFQRLAMVAASDSSEKILLSAEQERVIWAQVVREAGDIDPAQVETLATLAMDAWSTVHLWEVPLAAVARTGGRQEVRAFLRWARRFEERCSDLGAIDQHRFARQLATSEDAVPDRLPAFEFFGFSRVPGLLERIERRFGAGGRAQTLPAGQTGATFECRAFANSEMEINAAMTWASAEKRRRPQASVMVALAGVSRVDAILEQRLLRAFSVGNDIGGMRGTRLSCPSTVSLADTPLVQSALLILDRRRVRPWDEVSRLLLSPYLGEAEAEQGQRALLDARLRRRGDVEVAITSVVDVALRSGVNCPALAARLEALMSLQDSLPHRQSMHAWMTVAERCLNAAGWPGERELSGAEQTALSDWRRVMDVAAELDAVLPACSWQTAFGRWRDILRRRQLARVADVNAVQVVTLDEAAFVDADALWVAGVHDGAWPQPLEINPLLPFALQREHGLPGADPARELEHGEVMLGQLRYRHPDAIWSYPLTEAETPRRPLAGAVCTPTASTAARPWSHRAVVGGFEVVDDTYATALPGAAELGGGVALFTDQAACPFRALARHRLGARAPEDASPGLNGMQRGSLVHAVLAAFWSRVRSSVRLAALGEDEIQSILENCVAVAVEDFRRRFRLLDAYWELERTRLRDLVMEWLHEELQRGDFEVVACEQSRSAQIGGYSINTRVDRIDRLANEELLIIDYKTGSVSRSSWLAPRPDEPQLPLYAVSAVGERVGAIAYAAVKKGACKIVDEPPGIVGDVYKAEASRWSACLQDWDNALADLAEELASGYAPADPKRGVSTCRRCDLQCLCRIGESRSANTRVPDEA